MARKVLLTTINLDISLKRVWTFDLFSLFLQFVLLLLKKKTLRIHNLYNSVPRLKQWNMDITFVEGIYNICNNVVFRLLSHCCVFHLIFIN